MKKLSLLFILLVSLSSVIAAPWDIKKVTYTPALTPTIESVTLWVDDYPDNDRLGISVHFVSGTMPVNTTWKVEIPTKVITDVRVLMPFPHTERKLITIIYECNVSYAMPGESFYILFHNEEFVLDGNGYVIPSEYYVSNITQVQ